MHWTPPTYQDLDCRTVAMIQQQVIKQRKQNVVTRLFLAKACKDAITGWNEDLNRILRIFNVRSVGNGCARYILTAFQTELGINNHLLIADIHRVVVPGPGQGGVHGNLVSMIF